MDDVSPPSETDDNQTHRTKAHARERTNSTVYRGPAQQYQSTLNTTNPQVGATEGDFNIAVRALRSWRMCESVRWLDLHLSREAHGSTVREDAALIMSGMFGHVLAPMRVCGSSTDGQVGLSHA